MILEEDNIILYPNSNQIIDTERIQEAIDFASSNKKCLIFEKGIYFTGTLYLRDYSRICFKKGSVLVGSADLKDYTVTEFCHQSKKNYWQSIFYGKDIKNIEFYGEGKICGQGDKFPYGLEAFSANDYAKSPVQEFMVRPSLLYLKKCQNIKLYNIEFCDAAQFAVLVEECNDILIDGITIINRKNQNTDGIHFSRNSNIQIRNCIIDSGDDALVFNRAVSNLIIENCDISSRWAGIRIGPFSDGDFFNIEILNCRIHDTYGCALKVQIGQGGNLKDLYIHDIKLERVTGPIHMNLCHIPHWESECFVGQIPGSIENVTIEKITATVIAEPHPLPHEVPVSEGELFSCVNIQGLAECKIKNLTFCDWNISYEGGYQDLNYTLRLPKEVDYRYPEYFLFGIMPCYAFYGAHIDCLFMKNITFLTEEYDVRIPMILSDVQKMKQINVCVQN